MTEQPADQQTASDARRQELLLNLGRAIMSDPRISTAKWQQLTLVIDRNEFDWRTSGFGYDTDETGAAKTYSIAPSGLAVTEAAAVVHDEIRRDGHQFLSCLVSINKTTGQFDTNFEYQRPHLFTITQGNIQERAVSLKPAAKAN